MNWNQGSLVRTITIFLAAGFLCFAVAFVHVLAQEITSTPAPSATPSLPPTPACSPCAVSARGNVYESFGSQPLEDACVLLEWEDRCWGEQRQEVFTDAGGYYETIQLGTHAVGQGRLTASFSGYGTDHHEFISCGDHIRDFFLEPLAPAPPEFFQLTEVQSLRVTTPRGTTRYDLAYQLRDTAGEIYSRGHIFDTENRFYSQQSGEGAVLLRSFAHQGFSTEPGDNLLVTYDGGRQKRIYLPALTGYTELYVASDGSTYYDSDLLLPAQFALSGTPTPTLTPRGYHSPTPTPQGFTTSSPTPRPQPSCMSCPDLSPGSITLTEQTSSREVIYNFIYDCRRNPDQIHNWWTSATDWLEVDPPQGFGFDSQTFVVTVSLGDTSSLAPGEYREIVNFHDDWICDMADLQVNFTVPPPTPAPTPAHFLLGDLENLQVTHPRGDWPYDLVYRLRDAGGSTTWGHIYDRQNTFYDLAASWSYVRIEAFAHSGYSPQAGDDLRLTYDGGKDFHIYLPAFSGYLQLFVGSDGATYYDFSLTNLAQAALPPTPSTTPTPNGYRTPTPTPSSSPTPDGYLPSTPCPCAPNVDPPTITLTDREPSRTVTYHMLWSNTGLPGEIYSWWTSATDWLVVDPHRGFGFEPQNFTVTVSLGDTSSLGPGLHYGRVYFHDDWDFNTWLNVTYVVPTPTPGPTPTPPVLVLDSGDFDGDGTAEIAVFRPASGLWASRGLSRFYFGRAGDLPVSGDYRGDGTAGAAIYRPANGLWAIRNLTRVYTGFTASVPVPGDYDGNGSCDIGIYRQGLWSIPGLTRFWFGSGPYIPVPGDYTGDGRTDMAVFRGERNLWAVRGITRIYFGGAGDRPVPGDYLGDGCRVPAIFRPAAGLWVVRGWTRVYYGRGEDFPVSADFTGAGYDDPAVFRPATGLWAVRGQTRAYFGAPSDLPATR